MVWLEIHQSLPTHRKTLALADELDIEPVHVVGHLTCLWLWALDNAPDGDVSGISDRTLARAAQWSGDAATFRACLWAAGLVDQDGHIHDWDDYAGRLVQKREANADRMRRARAAHKPDESATPDDRAENVQCTSNARTGATEQNHTGPTPPTPLAGGRTQRAKREPGVNLRPLVDAFLTRGMKWPVLLRGEDHAAGELLKHFEPDDIAACWQAIAAGEYGDGFSGRDLSFSFLATRNRLGNWLTLRSQGRANGLVRVLPQAPRPGGAVRRLED